MMEGVWSGRVKSSVDNEQTVADGAKERRGPDEGGLEPEPGAGDEDGIRDDDGTCQLVVAPDQQRKQEHVARGPGDANQRGRRAAVEESLEHPGDGAPARE